MLDLSHQFVPKQNHIKSSLYNIHLKYYVLAICPIVFLPLRDADEVHSSTYSNPFKHLCVNLSVCPIKQDHLWMNNNHLRSIDLFRLMVI